MKELHNNINKTNFNCIPSLFKEFGTESIRPGAFWSPILKRASLISCYVGSLIICWLCSNVRDLPKHRQAGWKGSLSELWPNNCWKFLSNRFLPSTVSTAKISLLILFLFAKAWKKSCLDPHVWNRGFWHAEDKTDTLPQLAVLHFLSCLVLFIKSTAPSPAKFSIRLVLK